MPRMDASLPTTNYRGSSSNLMYNANRQELFGDIGSRGNRVGSRASGNLLSESTQQAFISENDGHISRLSDKVGVLKSLSIDIEGEIKEQNVFLDTMGLSFDRSKDMLSATMGRLNGVIQSGGSKHMCYLIFFVFFVLLFLWYLLRRS